MKYSPLLALPFLLCVSQSAEAHLRLTSHQARYGDQQKAGPCGTANGQRTTDKVYIAKPGSQVMLVWDEYIGHNPSFYRIDFDLDGDDDFTVPILPCADQNSIEDCFDLTNTGPYMVNNIEDVPEAVQGYLYTLPDVECDNCTLQVVQVMQDKPPFTDPGNEMYYQCVDIVLDNNGPDELTLIGAEPADAGPTSAGADAGANPGGDAGANAGGDAGGSNADPVGGGCQSSGSSQGLLVALVALLALYRRQRLLPVRSRVSR